MAMKKNHIFKRITAATLAVMTAFMLLPAGGGDVKSVSAANIASGVEGTLGSVNINGYNTMYDYITNNFTYTDQMKVSDYQDSRSASYDRNETSTGKNSTDYLLQSVEWTDVNNGEALLSVAGKDTTDSVALYVFTTCISGGSQMSYKVIENICDLLNVYDRVDVICDAIYYAWGTWDEGANAWNDSGAMDMIGHVNEDGYAAYDNYYHGAMQGLSYKNGTQNGVVKSLTTANAYCGITPYVSFYAEDYSSQDALKADVLRYVRGVQWGGNHPSDALLSCIKSYVCGNFSYERWNTAQITSYEYGSSTCINNMRSNMSSGFGMQESSNRPLLYGKELYTVLDTPFNECEIVNVPTAIYYYSAHDGGAALADAEQVVCGAEPSFLSWLAENYQNDGLKYYTIGDGGPVSTSGYVSGIVTKGSVCPRAKKFGASCTYRFDYLSQYNDLGRIGAVTLYAGYNPKYLNENWVYFYNNCNGPSNSNFKPNSSQGRYKYDGRSLASVVAQMPDKQLSFDIPIGSSWQVDFNHLPKSNLVYTYKYSNTGRWATTSSDGKKLQATVSIDANNVIHITTNTYVKGAEISIQIPLKYSADGVQSAKQLRVGEDGKVYTDGKTGTAVDDTYIISMTAGDTKLHVGPDILGDLDTSLSIYMPSSDLMDVEVNLHWLNDSAEIKNMLGDTSVRRNATALIGSEALVGNKLGKQSDDDEKAGGIGTSVVAMNFADANGNVGAIASSYTDSDGVVKQLSNGSVDLQLRTKNGLPDLWTDSSDEAGSNNVVTYMMYNVPRFGHPTANTYDANGNVTGIRDLASGIVPRYYYVEDVVNVPTGYIAYNITDMASSDLAKLQKGIGTDSENPMMYNNPLYYAYTVTPPSDWNSKSKVTYKIDCYVALDIKSLKMTVEHYQEQLTGDGYTPSTNKQYKLESSIDSYEAITSVYSPAVKTYPGYDSPDRQSVTVTVTGERVVKYYYDLHYYDIAIDTQGGEWYEEQSDGTWISIPEPPAHYTILTPTFTLQKPDKVGFDFEGYTGTDLKESTLDVAITKGSTGDRSYKANWLAQAYDVEVPVSLVFSAGYDGVMKGAFDQSGSGVLTDDGYLLNNSKFPVQVTGIEYDNKSVYTMSDEKSDKPNIMNWRLDATNGSNTYNVWATALEKSVNVSGNETYWMAQNSKGKVLLDSDQAWYRNDEPDIKDRSKIGTIVWTFGIGHRNVVSRSVTAAK